MISMLMARHDDDGDDNLLFHGSTAAWIYSKSFTFNTAMILHITKFFMHF